MNASDRPGGASGDTVVVVPSISFPAVELRRIAAVQSYEERMLFVILLLADPSLQLVYVTSAGVDPATIDYYLSFLADPGHARGRLHLVAVGDPSIGSLSAKLLRTPAVLDEMRAAIRRPAAILPFNVTQAEQDLADALQLSLLGPSPDRIWLGSKSGSRRVATEAGVATLLGADDLFSLGDLAKAMARIGEQRPGTAAVVVKLNNGFSGQGNAIVELGGWTGNPAESPTTFCAAGESWGSFEAKLVAEGAIVEELVRSEGLRSPSVQLQISPNGAVEVLSTHDQILGGPANQVYLGCRFPADPRYRLTIQHEARKVGTVLASRGVTGAFGIDFLVHGDQITLSEINLRMGGTTHPFWMARLATGATYRQDSGELVAPDGCSRCYVATDNLKSQRLVGLRPQDAIDRLTRAGLGFDPSSATGATLHLLGALPEAGKMGITCMERTPAEADDLYRRSVAALDPVLAPQDV